MLVAKWPFAFYFYFSVDSVKMEGEREKKPRGIINYQIHYSFKGFRSVAFYEACHEIRLYRDRRSERNRELSSSRK